MPRLLALMSIALMLGATPPAALAAPSADDVFRAVVQVSAEVPGDARTAELLGTERAGSGVVIDDRGLVVTIGYLILEAMAATITDSSGQSVPAEIVAYDYESGFGLLRALAPIAAVPLMLGDSDQLAAGTPALVLAHGGSAAALPARVSARQEFAGYWEYLLDSAIFTTPLHPAWAGAGLIGADGKLLGIGSLQLPSAPGAQGESGNMFVPVNLLKPILGDLLAEGRRAGASRPWLGMFTQEQSAGLVVTRVAPDSPADRAGIRPGDRVRSVGEQPVAGMADLYRKVWSLGAAGVEVPVEVETDGLKRAVRLRSIDRYDYLKLNPTY